MVYLAELLVVMTDQLKIVRNRAWNVHRAHGQEFRRRVSLSLQKNDTVAEISVTGEDREKNRKLTLVLLGNKLTYSHA